MHSTNYSSDGNQTKYADAEHKNPRNLTHAFDIMIIAVVSLVLFSWLVMGVIYLRKRKLMKPDEDFLQLIPFTLNYNGNGGGTGLSGSRRKSRKFEDYWDEESEELQRRPTRGGNASGSLMVMDDWDDTIDFSSHSIPQIHVPASIR